MQNINTMGIFTKLFGQKVSKQTKRQQEYAQVSEYRNAGVTCDIIEAEVPSFTWNIDERKIVWYPNTHHIHDGRFEIKPGNRIVNVRMYTEIPKDVIEEINLSEGIAIMPRTHYEVEKTSELRYYRFAILPSE